MTSHQHAGWLLKNRQGRLIEVPGRNEFHNRKLYSIVLGRQQGFYDTEEIAKQRRR
jgi:hypothetical protein